MPARLLVLGGGVVGVEMAHAYASFGTERDARRGGAALLAREEPFAGEEVCDALADAGVEIRADAHATAVARADGAVTRRARRRHERRRGDEILVAVGRAA